MLRILSRVSRFVTRLEEAVLAFGILGIAGLTIGNVLGRTLFGESLFFAEEVSQFLIVAVTFVGLGYAAGQGRHIRMTALYDLLPGAGRRRLMLVISSSTALLLFALTYLGIRYVLGTVRPLGAVSPVLGVPLWQVYLVAPIGFGLGGLQYALTFAKNLTADVPHISFTLEDIHEAPPEDGI